MAAVRGRAVIALATTRVDVLRGSTTDDYADPVDDNTGQPVLAGLACSLMERTRRVFNPVDGTPRIVRYVVGRVPHGTDVQVGDRLRDTGDRTLYMVESIDQPQHPALGLDLRLDLKKIN